MTLVEQQIQKIFEIFMGDRDTLAPSKEWNANIHFIQNQ